MHVNLQKLIDITYTSSRKKRSRKSSVLQIQIRIDFGRPDPDPSGQKWPTIIEKKDRRNFKEMCCFEVPNVLIWRLEASL